MAGPFRTGACCYSQRYGRGERSTADDSFAGFSRQASRLCRRAALRRR